MGFAYLSKFFESKIIEFNIYNYYIYSTRVWNFTDVITRKKVNEGLGKAVSEILAI